MNEMNALEIARRLAELGETSKAMQAYTLAIGKLRGKDPASELEAALFIFQNGGNYKVAYDSFKALYHAGYMREDLLNIMTQAFYEPNVKLLKSRYEKNCKLLQKYPYLFRKDFPSFEELPIRFYPYDDNGYVPFRVKKELFDDYINFNHPVVSRNFFSDLENPILATDVFSQYELEYLRDNVRRSEDIGRENHIYLHYTDWGTFCAHLQVLNLRPLLREKKLVFLIGDEIAQYPIDFQTRFGIDYGIYPVKPVGIREYNRLIWHTQLSYHNGGDFFNEIFDNHPNLIAVSSLMMDNILERMGEIREHLKQGDQNIMVNNPGDGDLEKCKRLFLQLKAMKNITDKDIFVLMFVSMADLRPLDSASRIIPALFFQPHFGHYNFTLSANDKGRAVLDSPEYENIHNFGPFKEFKYIKTFTPMRRPTTSMGAAIRFMIRGGQEASAKDGKPRALADLLFENLLNRSFMVDWEDRLFKDSVLVRFEDGKLNPKATFTALAAFLDLPYTQSMTYCSLNGEIDPESLAGNDLGFSPAAIYRTYDEYLGNNERYLYEYFLRDVYERYGYSFNYYDGAPMTEEQLEERVRNLDGFTNLLLESYRKVLGDGEVCRLKTEEGAVSLTAEKQAEIIADSRFRVAKTLYAGLRFINKQGRPLNFMPKLQLDPALLEQPLYH